MKTYLPSWPKQSAIARLEQHMLIKQSTLHWSWDGKASRKQSVKNVVARRRQAKIDKLVAGYIAQMNLK